MGLITRCSSCGTMFKVVADQLRISDGWVRCGHCTDIFDATADLRDESQLGASEAGVRGEVHEEPAPEQMGVAVAAPADVGSFHEATPQEPVDTSSEYPSSLHSEVHDSVLDEPPDPVEIEQAAQSLRENPLDEPFELRRADSGDVEEAGPHGFSKPMPLETESQLEDLSFVRQARRHEFWRTPMVRGVLLFMLLALGTALAAQIALHERDRLAAAYPSSRPLLAGMCAAVGCRLGPPRLIDMVGIETSSFNKLRSDAYRLNVTLRNQASVPVAMPALELTLTDSQDQPVLRRVLQPADFAPGTAALASSADWSTSVGVSVQAGVGGGRIAGYRLLAFYP